MLGARQGDAVDAGSRPDVGGRGIAGAGQGLAERVVAAPDDHLVAGPPPCVPCGGGRNGIQQRRPAIEIGAIPRSGRRGELALAAEAAAQTIISVPIQIALWRLRALGALVVSSGVQALASGSWRPRFRYATCSRDRGSRRKPACRRGSRGRNGSAARPARRSRWSPSRNRRPGRGGRRLASRAKQPEVRQPPQTIIAPPLQTALCSVRASGGAEGRQGEPSGRRRGHNGRRWRWRWRS